VSPFQFTLLLGVVVLGIVLVIAAIPWSVERAVGIRWKEIVAMFDRALMHGGSLDTLSEAIRESSAESRVIAEEARAAAGRAVDGVSLLHKRVRALEEHTFMRPPRGNVSKGVE